MFKKIALLSLILLISGLLLYPFNNQPIATAQAIIYQADIDPTLQVVMNGQPVGQQIPIIVTLNDQLDLKNVTGKDRAELQKNLIEGLRKKADTTQPPLRNLLQAGISTSAVKSFVPIWLQNAILTTANQSVINTLAQRPEVKKISLDADLPPPPKLTATTGPTPSFATPETNLTVIKAPDMWALGFTGTNVTVAVLDTGVDVTHPDLSAQYRGGTNSWFDPYNIPASTTPYDLSSGPHGTEVLGVILGQDKGGTTIGVAPNAKWIAAKIYADNGSAQTSKVIQALQWVLDPDGNSATPDAPQVVNNSWTSNTGGCDTNTNWNNYLQPLITAGITPVFSAGNYGPNANTSASPANYSGAFAVGATNNSDVIYNSSSRGPTTCGIPLTPSRTFPNVVAPGASIKTTDIYIGVGFNNYTTVSGTSLSAPHVTGAIALLLSAYPTLTVSQLENALSNTALDLGTAGVDNTFGAGRINVLAAYNSFGSGCSQYLVSQLNDGVGDCGTLYYAITQANTNATVSNPVTISFPLAGGDYSVTKMLPALGDYVTVNGGCNSGTPKVNLLVGSGASQDGLTLNSNAAINGLAIGGFSRYGLNITGDNNSLTCTWVGLKKDGSNNKNTVKALNLASGSHLLLGKTAAGNGNRFR